MSDLVKRLKDTGTKYEGYPLYWEAAARIEQLEAALRKIAQDKGIQGYRIIPKFDAEEMMKLARATLAPEQDK
jgi:hypothetical protein